MLVHFLTYSAISSEKWEWENRNEKWTLKPALLFSLLLNFFKYKKSNRFSLRLFAFHVINYLQERILEPHNFLGFKKESWTEFLSVVNTRLWLAERFSRSIPNSSSAVYEVSAGTEHPQVMMCWRLQAPMDWIMVLSQLDFWRCWENL